MNFQDILNYYDEDNYNDHNRGDACLYVPCTALGHECRSWCQTRATRIVIDSPVDTVVIRKYPRTGSAYIIKYETLPDSRWTFKQDLVNPKTFIRILESLDYPVHQDKELEKALTKMLNLGKIEEPWEW